MTNEQYPRTEWRVMNLPRFQDRYPAVPVGQRDDDFPYPDDNISYEVEVREFYMEGVESYVVRITENEGIAPVPPDSDLWEKVWEKYLQWQKDRKPSWYEDEEDESL